MTFQKFLKKKNLEFLMEQWDETTFQGNIPVKIKKWTQQTNYDKEPDVIAWTNGENTVSTYPQAGKIVLLYLMGDDEPVDDEIKSKLLFKDEKKDAKEYVKTMTKVINDLDKAIKDNKN